MIHRRRLRAPRLKIVKHVQSRCLRGGHALKVNYSLRELQEQVIIRIKIMRLRNLGDQLLSLDQRVISADWDIQPVPNSIQPRPGFSGQTPWPGALCCIEAIGDQPAITRAHCNRLQCQTGPTLAVVVAQEDRVWRTGWKACRPGEPHRPARAFRGWPSDRGFQDRPDR